METKTLISFLSENNGFIEIPIYQRAYEWESNHIDQFIDDLEHFMSSEDEYPHFFGMVVLVKKEETLDSGDIEIIDGQQRITTFCLLLSMIRDWLIYETEREDSYKMDRNKSTRLMSRFDTQIIKALYHEESIVDRKFIPKLMSKNTKPFESEITYFMLCDFERIRSNRLNDFENYLSTREKLFYVSSREDVFNDDEGQSINEEAEDYNEFHNCFQGLTAKSSKSRAIVKNYKQIKDQFFMEKIGNLPPTERSEKLDKLLDVILKRFRIIPYKTASRSEAFNLFEVLNDRGKRVSHADLIKNLCIIKDEDKLMQKAMYDEWQESLSNKVPKDLINFLRYSYLSRTDFARKSDLFSKYKALLIDKESSLCFF